MKCNNSGKPKRRIQIREEKSNKVKTKEKEKLVLISPSGKEYPIGFLSPSADGFVLGKAQTRKEESSHLTILKKKGTISAHITSQNALRKRQYFHPFSLKELTARFQMLLDNKIIFQLTEDQMSQDVVYITKGFLNWYDLLVKALFQTKREGKTIVYVINFRNLIEKFPSLFDMLRNSITSFFGLCKARDMLTNDAIVAGITNSKLLIIPIENELIGIELGVFTDFLFLPSMNKSQLRNPLAELYESLGITQYIQQEVTEKKFLENLLSKEDWQAAGTELGAKLDQSSNSAVKKPKKG